MSGNTRHQLHNIAHVRGVRSTVLEKKENKVFLDVNNDGVSEHTIDFNESGVVGVATAAEVYKYIKVWDTVVLHPDCITNGSHNPAYVLLINAATPCEIEQNLAPTTTIQKIVRATNLHNGKIR